MCAHGNARGKHPAPKHPVGLPARSPTQTPCAAVRRAPSVEMPTNDKASAPIIEVYAARRSPAHQGARSKHPAPKHPDGLPSVSPAQTPCAAARRAPGAEMPANDKASAPIIRGVRCPSLPRVHTKVHGAKHPEPKHPVGLPSGNPAQTPSAAVRRASGAERPRPAPPAPSGRSAGRGLPGRSTALRWSAAPRLGVRLLGPVAST